MKYISVKTFDIKRCKGKSSQDSPRPISAKTSSQKQKTNLRYYMTYFYKMIYTFFRHRTYFFFSSLSNLKFGFDSAHVPNAIMTACIRSDVVNSTNFAFDSVY